DLMNKKITKNIVEEERTRGEKYYCFE
ncbi:hypothetical protein CCACVL1_21586, partial [Corchorus capsularis]